MVIYFSQLKWVQRPRSRCQHGCVWAKAPFFLGNRHLLPCPHLVDWMRGLYRISFIRTLISFMRPHSQDLSTSPEPHLPKASPSDTITMGLGFNSWILGGHKHSDHNIHKDIDERCHFNIQSAYESSQWWIGSSSSLLFSVLNIVPLMLMLACGDMCFST